MIYDILIRNGKIIDGTGSPWIQRDVALLDGRIAALGHFSHKTAGQIIDATGKFVCPGFIDMHTHSDLTIFFAPTAENVIRQGVTTHVTGNCGISPAPMSKKYSELLKRLWEKVGFEIEWNWQSFGEYLNRIEQTKMSLNIVPLVGHGTIRLAVLGFEARAPTTIEMEQMKEYVEEAMAAGAWGMSTGLVYPTGCFANTNELIILSRVVAKYHGIYASHIRGERETITEAVREAIKIGERAGISVQISHNAPKYGGWGKTKETLPLIEAARARGVEVTVDNDTHTDFGPKMSAILPQWLREFSTNEIVERLKDQEQRGIIKEEILLDKRPAFGPSGLIVHGRWDRIFLLYCQKNKDIEGKTFAQIATLRNKDPFDVYFDLLIEERDTPVVLFDYIDEAEIELLLQHPLVIISSDGWVLPEQGITISPPPYTPCSYGEYPGVLERYVREKKVLRLEEAIRKMTSFPAAKLGLLDRGLLRKGMCADITIFELEKVKDKASNRWPHAFPFENYPHEYPEGIDYVLVNGQLTIEEGMHTGVLNGKLLRHTWESPNSFTSYK
ncbi:MAG: amidohydrolase family protein [Candidatus Heimdallarchaeota archaeon]